MTLNSILILGLVGGALACLVTAIYAIPMIRTWRKDRGIPLRRPGPELEAHELGVPDLKAGAAHAAAL